jgi:hypothetical protein
MDNRQPDIDFKPVVKLFTPDFGFVFMNRGGIRRLLNLTEREDSSSDPSHQSRLRVVRFSPSKDDRQYVR